MSSWDTSERKAPCLTVFGHYFHIYFAYAGKRAAAKPANAEETNNVASGITSGTRIAAARKAVAAGCIFRALITRGCRKRTDRETGESCNNLDGPCMGLYLRYTHARGGCDSCNRRNPLCEGPKLIHAIRPYVCRTVAIRVFALASGKMYRVTE